MTRRTTGKLVTTGRNIPIRGSITRMASSSCIARLLVMAAEDQVSPMLAYIDSPGGIASEALRIISTLDGIRCPVATFCRGQTGGAGALIAAHGLRGFRTASPAASFCFKFDPENRRHETLDSYLKLLVDVLAHDTQQPEEQIRIWLQGPLTFNAQQALAHGLVDQVAAEPVLPPKNQAPPVPLLRPQTTPPARAT